MQTPEERLAELYIKCKKALRCDGVPCGGPERQYRDALERNSERAMEMAIFLYEKELKYGCDSYMWRERD